jgi:hypothetical protein
MRTPLSRYCLGSDLFLISGGRGWLNTWLSFTFNLYDLEARENHYWQWVLFLQLEDTPSCLYGMLFIGMHNRGRQQVAVVTNPWRRFLLWGWALNKWWQPFLFSQGFQVTLLVSVTGLFKTHIHFLISYFLNASHHHDYVFLLLLDMWCKFRT